MNDIGFVKYSFNENQNKAEWIYKINDKEYTGTGKVEGDFSGSYEGRYKVTYFNDIGEVTHKYEMEIIKTENHYLLHWYQKGKLLYVGIGNVYDNVLYAGWRLMKS
ncbi:MAG: hypothetical protein PVH88_13545 [Ignavibacteria bacterium]|jgi:hypothetical protein